MMRILEVAFGFIAAAVFVLFPGTSFAEDNKPEFAALSQPAGDEAAEQMMNSFCSGPSSVEIFRLGSDEVVEFFRIYGPGPPFDAPWNLQGKCVGDSGLKLTIFANGLDITALLNKDGRWYYAAWPEPLGEKRIMEFLERAIPEILEALASREASYIAELR